MSFIDRTPRPACCSAELVGNWAREHPRSSKAECDTCAAVWVREFCPRDGEYWVVDTPTPPWILDAAPPPQPRPWMPLQGDRFPDYDRPA